ncbi:globin [Teladorsagia circumcincta]|uniref:Globin n=1 Tax=Teladorsagia circumcincta TaxID=45464 RepID=A0A2G9U0M9_TELCI|nr:globin [Teladorsagia circumcincta]
MADVKKACMESLKVVPLGRTPAEIQNGTDFYKYLFGHHPDLRKYFKGAESFTPDDVQKSDRFAKQGTALLMTVHIFANTYDNYCVKNKINISRFEDMVFRSLCRDLMDRHVGRNVDPSLWKGFWGIWTAFLESKGASLSGDQKAAWEKLGATFNEECQQHLAKLGLPHT